ncbi:MAG: YidC/Oxa1 family membrane protein insertase [bacterium]
MDSLINIFNLILYQPLFNALVLLYEYVPGSDFGVAVILLTAFIRLVLYPSMVKSIKTQKIMSEIQPKIQEIRKKFKDDKEKQSAETMALYRQAKINPFGGCLPLLLQLPILFALYRVFWTGFDPEQLSRLYSFVPRPEAINPSFLGVIDLSSPFWGFAILAAAAQFFQGWHQNKYGGGQGMGGMMQKQMLYFFPIFTVFILWRLPSAIGLYWLVSSLFSIFQQHLIFKPNRYGQVKP